MTSTCGHSLAYGGSGRTARLRKISHTLTLSPNTVNNDPRAPAASDEHLGFSLHSTNGQMSKHQNSYYQTSQEAII